MSRWRYNGALQTQRSGILCALAISASLSVPAHAAGDPILGAIVFKKCVACHTATADSHSVGPSLRGLLGRRIASTPGFKFSPALSAVKGNWSPANIDRFLLSPQQFAKGTRMAFSGLKNAEDRANVIAYLQSTAAANAKQLGE